MHPDGFRVDLENIKDRLVFARDVKFNNYVIAYPPHEIFCVKPDDIFFVSPALFIWIDSGIQPFNGLTKSPSYLKLIDTSVCEVPVKDFQETNRKYSNLLMISNLNFNPNFKAVKQVETEVNILKGYIKKAKDFFTGENFSE